jgi:hypothetical protein
MMENNKVEEKRGTGLKCQRCNWEWIYTGRNPYVATCPFCRTNISIRKYKRLLEQRKKENKLQQIQSKGVSHSIDESIGVMFNQTTLGGGDLTIEK